MLWLPVGGQVGDEVLVEVIVRQNRVQRLRLVRLVHHGRVVLLHVERLLLLEVGRGSGGVDGRGLLLLEGPLPL